ncbi:unnamed protein product [Mytilus edulis]|uniref:Uncharacterized protein n=1 Tax=Mytilus edulis TaxID=6550 RepID=A0A8S3U2T6_MYTED|nr:unnamed protein product [Mytilus edulis]
MNTKRENCSVESCDADQFQCTNGQCIPAKAKCDDNFECLDYSDELNCISVQPCPDSLYQCETGQCVDNKAKCTSIESVMPSPSSFVDDQLVSTATAYIPSQTSNHRVTPMLTSSEIYEKHYSSSFILDANSYSYSLEQTTLSSDSFSSYITTSPPSHTASRSYSYLKLYSTQSTTFKLSPESNLQPSKSLASLVSLSSLQPPTTVGQLSDIISSNTDQRTTTQTHIVSNFIASSMTIGATDNSWISVSEPSVHGLLYTIFRPNKLSSRDVQSMLITLTTSEQHRTSTSLNGLFESTSSSTEHPTIKTTPSFESTIPEDKKDNGTAFPYWVIPIIAVIILIAMTILYIIYRHYIRKRTRKKEFGSITSIDIVHPDIVPKKTKPKYNG